MGDSKQGSDEFVKHFLKVTDEVEICYLERKGKSTSELIVLVHGFSGRKEVLTGFFSLLPAHFQVVVVDVPGHGESKPCDEKADYTIDAQVEYLHKFVKAMGYGEKKFNLLGASMGGHIAGVYAAKYGNMLKSVTLVSAAGINAPVSTRYFDAVDDDIPLLPTTEDGVQELMKDTSYQYDPMGQEVLHGIIQDMKQRRPVLKKVFEDITRGENRYKLDSLLEKIDVPLLCLWGKQDKITDASAAEVIKKRVKNAEVHVLDQSGHGALAEKADECIKILTEFLAKIKSS